MALLTEGLQKWDKPGFSTLQSCLAGNISLQMDKPGSSRGNGDPLNWLVVFVEWLATVLWNKSVLSAAALSQCFNGVVSDSSHGLIMPPLLLF